MVFGRRKSGTQLDAKQDDCETRRRNRLSKPLTNKSTSNLALLAAPDSSVGSRNASTDAVAAPASPLALPQLSDAEKRQQIKAQIFDANDEPERTISKRSSWIGVAALVNKIEGDSSQGSLILPQKQRGSMTSLFSSRRSSLGAKIPVLSNASSMDCVMTLPTEPSMQSSSATITERVPEIAFPSTRRASFIPGAATRKVSSVESIQEESPQPLKQESQEDPILEGPHDDSYESDSMSFLEGDDEDWFPPPQIPRSETPQGLDYTHLGGLRLGSLQVINGRASPAASVASRQLLAHLAARRDASSEYGDSEAGDGYPFMLSATARTPQVHSREVSWYSQRTSKLQNVEIFELPALVVQESAAVDLAAAMAAEYIAELPDSPYKMRRSSSDSTKRKERVKEMELPSDQEIHSLRKSQSLETISPRSSSPVPSVQSSTGSVLRITTKRNEFDDELFDDETLGGHSRNSPEPDHVSVESFHSWHSSPKPEFAITEAFESAVEFQRFPSPQKSPQRSPLRSPIRSPQAPFERPLENTVDASQRLELPGGMVQSDSGYSSNNSVRSSSWERKSTLEQQRSQSPDKSQQMSQPPHVEPARAPGRLHKPILKTKKTAPAVPSFSELRPAPPKPAVSTASNIPKLEAEKPKMRKKLQKKQLFGKKRELFVQSVASVDDLTIPVIPPEIQANLQIRTQQVPELDKTYRNSHHLRNQASMSMIDLSQVELRFPSPGPEPAPQPKSRRRSWLPGRKEDKSKVKHSSTINERDAKAIINHFGSDNYYLGSSPYDFAHENAPRAVSRHNSNRLTPFNASTKPPRPRSMFDDKTAAELARMRSSSIRERDSWNSRRSSFNDRGGIPGKTLRPASIAGDAPPLPPMPSPEVLERRLSGMASHAPTPPPHSPRPSYVEPEPEIKEPETAPPPPPCHSPRPMDVSNTEDPWAAQAAAWKDRRNGLGEAFKRRSYHSDYDHTQGVDQMVEKSEPLYPEIPQRGQQTCYQTQRTYSVQPGAHAHDYDYEYDQILSYNQHNKSYHYQQPPSSNTPLQQPPHTRPEYQPQPHHQQSYQFLTQLYHTTHDSPRPLPQPTPPRRSPAPSIRSSHSHTSQRSHASSLAEELHPTSEEIRQHPPPEFGRYSGGLQYGYERVKGFGGSAGTRSVSGKAEMGHKGVVLREDWGVDLGDVPVIGVVKPVR